MATPSVFPLYLKAEAGGTPGQPSGGFIEAIISGDDIVTTVSASVSAVVETNTITASVTNEIVAVVDSTEISATVDGNITAEVG